MVRTRPKGYEAKKRGSRRRPEKKVLLIAAEGRNKTEKNYFRHFAGGNVNVCFVRGNETDPVQMARHMIEDCRDLDLSERDYAVCLADSDFDPRKDKALQQAEKEIQAAQKKVQSPMDLIVSGPCFEIWYICHFSYTTRQYAKTEDVLRELEKYIPGYRKGQEDRFLSMLDDKLETAIRNAKKLEQYCQENHKRAHHVEFMPSTEVYKVFEKCLR
ncbi:RloB family protein [uncultured Mitsuokella sp.]|uniref:RloB family protein n=1 Tax=uncultured Mitsuokella sp. TaxID=453120 RepID=UPI002670066E|nr:RloB family protein [uncultured Mitsuokella sp.]